ncbi:MAG: hypothetical protein FGM37_01860 [Phycisphaerales bacterium]|nr:hypothetical protein [Phycisphaerales bacterium]
MSQSHHRASGQHADDAVRILVDIARRHVEQLRRDNCVHSPGLDLLRQYRDYGFGLLGMLAGYCDATGVTCRDCLTLAIELQAAIEDAGRRRSASRDAPYRVTRYRRAST